MRFIDQSASIFLFLFYFFVGSLTAETLSHSDRVKLGGSPGHSTSLLYEETDAEDKIRYYLQHKQSKFVENHFSTYTPFDDCLSRDNRDQGCSYTKPRIHPYDPMILKSNHRRENVGLWNHSDKKSSLLRQVWRASEEELNPQLKKAKKNDKTEMQKALNFFGYDTGRPDGLLGQKAKNAVAKIQIGWQKVEPFETTKPVAEELGTFSGEQRKILIRDFYITQGVRLGSSSSLWIQELVTSSVNVKLQSTNVNNDGFCNSKGDLVEPVFLCTVQNLKRIKICETYNEIGDWNSFQYSFGTINQPPEFLIVSEISSVYVPGVVAKTSIENMQPSCIDTDDSQCETNHSMIYDFYDTYNQFIFLDGKFEYVVNASSWLGSKFRAYEGSIFINIINQALPLYHPNYRTVLAAFECDEGSIKNTVWDGMYVDKIINDHGLCWVDMGDESAEWRQCIP